MIDLASNQTTARKAETCEPSAGSQCHTSQCIHLEAERGKLKLLGEENDRLRNQLQEKLLLLELHRSDEAA